MRKQVFAESLILLPDCTLRLLNALLEKVNAIELYTGKLPASLEKESARLNGLSHEELVLKLLIWLNQLVQIEKLMYFSREDFINNTTSVIEKTVELLARNEKDFQGENLLDLLVYQNEKAEKIREQGKAGESRGALIPEPRSLGMFLHYSLEGSGAVLRSLSNQRLREQILPFIVYCVFQWSEEKSEEDVEKAIGRFVSFWLEKKGVYDHLQKKLQDHTYKIELEERLLEQKQSNSKVLQKQLDQIVDEKEKIRAVLIQRLPHDVHKLHGVLQGKAGTILDKLLDLIESKQEIPETEEKDEGLLRSLWNKIDSSIADHSTDREIKRLSSKLTDEMLGKDITQLPVYYMDRIKMIYDSDSKIQEIRRWRYQLDQEIEAHKDNIKHYRAHRATIEQQAKLIENEIHYYGS
ncbi:hypothetical protein [Aneurinibacillus terranovensis]|uniref:hypothetical protein n=1 Tax=Aneurinibacillus terranovensis TaxID=278991 RepID=UPI0003FCE4CB|nr:hypothetical protein [Aneurinibacillus terranovensis]